MASSAANSLRAPSRSTEGFRVGGRGTGSANAGAGVSGSALTTTSTLGETPSAPARGDVFASRFLRGRGLVTRSVMSMITEPCSGPEHRRPSRWHCWHVSGVSSHWRAARQHWLRKRKSISQVGYGGTVTYLYSAFSALLARPRSLRLRHGCLLTCSAAREASVQSGSTVAQCRR